VLRKIVRSSVDWYYLSLGNMDVIEIAKRRSIDIDWILEAGCHDGSDTVVLSNYFQPDRYLAFEPDVTARIKAIKLLKAQQINYVEVEPFGLSNIDGTAFLKYEAEGKGSGSTHFSNIGEDSIEIRKFDAHYKILQKNGLLWLDVEGHAVQALKGMGQSLKLISIARVEVQTHTRNKDFVQDYQKVIQIMKESGLIPIFGPVHPSFFGDIIFVRSSQLSLKDKARSKLLSLNMYLFHSFLFPLLHKPS